MRTYGQYAYALCMGFVRWSICSLLHRIFTTKSFRRASKCSLHILPRTNGQNLTSQSLVLACNIVNVFWIIFSIIIVSVRCIPFSKNWDIRQPGTCLTQVPIVTAVAGWGLAIELVIWVLPIPASWKLQLPRSSKFALTCIFGLGIFDIGVGVGRVITVVQVDEDWTWSQAPALQWSAIEPSIAIVVSCMCICRPLLDRILPQSWRLSAGSARSGEDHIKLVGNKAGVHHYSAAISGGSGVGSTFLPQTEQEEASNGGGIQVRRDVFVSADT